MSLRSPQKEFLLVHMKTSFWGKWGVLPYFPPPFASQVGPSRAWWRAGGTEGGSCARWSHPCPSQETPETPGPGDGAQRSLKVPGLAPLLLSPDPIQMWLCRPDSTCFTHVRHWASLSTAQTAHKTTDLGRELSTHNLGPEDGSKGALSTAKGDPQASGLPDVNFVLMVYFIF